MASLKDKTKRWLDEIAAYNHHKFNLDKDHTALLVIDMQNYFVHETGNAFILESREILDNIKSMQELFRSKGLPVIFTSHSHKSAESDGGNLTWWWDDYCQEGTFGAQIYDKIKPIDGEKVIHKHRYSAFEGTDLEITLRNLGITDLVITGVMTNLCCETTARYAFVKDYKVQFVCDATATGHEEFHIATLKNMAYGFAPVVTTKEVLNQLQ